MAQPDSIGPADRPRRSFLYRTLDEAGARFVEINGAAVAVDFGSAETEPDAARTMAVADLSPLPRFGCNGRGALEWVRGQGISIGDANNAAYAQPDGGLAARLADTEVLVLDSLRGSGTAVHRIEAAWSSDEASGAWPVNRQAGSFWMMVTGRHAPAIFAKLCGVDLRRGTFPPYAVAQTPVARVNCVVVRADLGDTTAFHLLGDCAAAEYQWGCLLDAMREFSGRPVGIGALWRLDQGKSPA